MKLLLGSTLEKGEIEIKYILIYISKNCWRFHSYINLKKNLRGLYMCYKLYTCI